MKETIPDKKQVTLFMVSNDAGQVRKIVLPASYLKSAVALGAIVLVALSAIVVDYSGLLMQTAENKRLKAENAQLTKQFQVVEGKVAALESSLERVKTFTTKLKLITNVDGEDRSLKLAMGATPAAGQPVDEMNEAPGGRKPLEDLAAADAPFVEEAPVNEQKGELVVESGKDYQTLAIRIEKSIRESQLREQSRFGYRVSPFTGRPALHTGLDIAAAPGSPVYAPADGVVTFAGYDEGYGKMITVDHGYGLTTRYGHNAQIYVQVGQKVQRWDVIASVGNTGRSTGPHLHYEVRVNGVPRDPALYILDD